MIKSTTTTDEDNNNPAPHGSRCFPTFTCEDTRSTEQQTLAAFFHTNLEVERQPDDAGHGRERDVALLEGGPDAHHPVLLGHVAHVAHGGGVRAGGGAGESEAGDQLSAPEAGQVVVLLGLGAVPDSRSGLSGRGAG